MNGHYQVGDVVFGNWTLTRKIGEGSFGKVFEAERSDFGTYKAAIKIITIPQSQGEVKSARAEGMDDASVTAYFRGFMEEIVQEFELMSKLKGHSNVVSYEDHMVSQHSEGIGWDIIIRMELLTPMLDYVQHHAFTRRDVMQLGIDMCRALELCQKYNIVHRDIKPENIFVSELGNYKLGDFGIARTVEKTIGGLSKKGTYTYMAPEVYKGEPYNSSVDIYSLGLVLYRLLNENRAPFLPPQPAPITYSDRESSFTKRMSGVALPQPKNADGRLAEIVLKAAAYQAPDRYSSPMQMRQELEAILYERAEAPVIYPAGDSTPIGPGTNSDPEPPQVEKASPLSPPLPAEPAIPQSAPDSLSITPEALPDATESIFQAPAAAGIGVESEAYSDATESIFSGAVSPAQSGASIDAGAYTDATESIFSGAPPVAVQDPDATVRGDAVQDFFRNPPAATERKPKPPARRSRPILFAAAGAGVILIVAAVIVVGGLLRRGNDAAPPAETAMAAPTATAAPTPTPAPTREPEPSATPAEWSEWASALPEGVDANAYLIEEKLQYRSAPLYKLQALPDESEGYTVFDSTESSAVTQTVYYYQDLNYSVQQSPGYLNIEKVWGPVQTSYTPVTATDTRKVWTGVVTIASQKPEYLCFRESEWSDYGDAPILSVENQVVNTRSMFRYIPRGAALPATMANFPAGLHPEAGLLRDVDDDGWFGANQTGYIGTAVMLGAMRADEYQSFRPEDAVTLSEALEAAVVINRIYTGNGASLAGLDLLSAAQAQGILRSKDQELTWRFQQDPDQLVTNAELVNILSRALPESELPERQTVASITDMTGDDYAKLYNGVALLARAGVVYWPEPEGTFGPDNEVSRSTLSAYVCRLAYPEMRE